MDKKNRRNGAYSPPPFISTLILTVVILNLILTLLCPPETEAKGMARGVNRNNGGGRTYLKKFGTRNVVYQRKIFNSKYQSADEIGFVGRTASDKFKKKISDGTAGQYTKKLYAPEVEEIAEQQLELDDGKTNKTKGGKGKLRSRASARGRKRKNRRH